jgi:hypothetical protein
MAMRSTPHLDANDRKKIFELEVNIEQGMNPNNVIELTTQYREWYNAIHGYSHRWIH